MSVDDLYQPGRAKRNNKGKKKRQDNKQEERLNRILPIAKKYEVTFEGNMPVKLSKQDKSSAVKLLDDYTASSRTGYRMVRSTHGAHCGTWYFEVKIEHLGDSGHCRLGWSSRKGEIEGPVGLDEHSVAYMDQGQKVYKSLRQGYGQKYEQGDVVGCLIHLPPGGHHYDICNNEVVEWTGQHMICEYITRGKTKTLRDSFVAFTKNGEMQGIAFKDLLEGTYYPALSMYTEHNQEEAVQLKINFGPEFAHPPPPSHANLLLSPFSRLSISTALATAFKTPAYHSSHPHPNPLVQNPNPNPNQPPHPHNPPQPSHPHPTPKTSYHPSPPLTPQTPMHTPLTLRCPNPTTARPMGVPT